MIERLKSTPSQVDNNVNTIPKGTAFLVTKHLLRLWSDLLLLLPPLLTLHSADLDSPGVGKLDPNTELQLVLSFMTVYKVVLLY